jgi:peroxiredoxin 2/4
VLAPANWERGQNLLRQPAATLDAVFGAGEQTEWFLKETPGAPSQ